MGSGAQRSAEPRDGFRYLPATFTDDQAALAELRGFFDALPLDPYMPKEAPYRYRRLSGITGPVNKLETQNISILQAPDVNPLFPGVQRSFEGLLPEMVACDAFRSAVSTFRELAQVSDDVQVDAHAIRTLAIPGAAGEPAPEGIHRDGAQVLGIFCVARTGLSGGITELYDADRKDAPSPSWRSQLEPGSCVVLNDRCMFHYTGRVQATRAAPGARDVLVLVCR